MEAALGVEVDAEVTVADPVAVAVDERVVEGEEPETVDILTDGSCIYTRNGAVLILSQWRLVPEPSSQFQPN